MFKSKFGYICTTINSDIDLSKEKLKLRHLKDERNNITFYANKPLNEYIKNNNLAQFCLRINKLVKFTKDCVEYSVPDFDVSIVKPKDVDLTDDEYDEFAEKQNDMELD